MEGLKKHPFFNKVDWSDIKSLQLPKKKMASLVKEKIAKVNKLDGNISKKPKDIIRPTSMIERDSPTNKLSCIENMDPKVQPKSVFLPNLEKKKSSIGNTPDVRLVSNAKRVKFFLFEIPGKLCLFETGKIIFVRSSNNDQRKFDKTNAQKIVIKNNLISIWVNSEKKYQFKILEGKMRDWEKEIKR